MIDSTTIPHTFRTFVDRLADRCVLEADDTRLTYAELDRLSNRIAHGLLSDSDRQPVAILASLAPSTLALFLGALKAGRVFAPVDPRDPPARIQEIVGQLGGRLICSVEEIAADRDDDVRVELSPDGPAAIYFTSGSTGSPRGVIRSHAQLVLPSLAHGFQEGERMALIRPLAFGGSIAGIFSPLVAGSIGCFFDPTARSVESLAGWIVDARINRVQTAPTALVAIAQALDRAGRTAPSVRLVYVGGEPCDGDQLLLPRRIFPNADIVNLYAATEAGYLACTRLAPHDTVPSGPIAFRTIYPDQLLTIVDEDGHPVAPGEAGEIHVAHSRMVALGFWGPPQDGDRLPVDEGNGLRSIQLRDRARLHADGTLELIGRSDLRVKIHGQTVDLQAVERALLSIPTVKEAVVSAVPGANGQPRLFAHIVFRRRTARRDVRVALADKLPPYAIPQMLVTVDAIPRNARGKVDRAALREAAATTPAPEVEYVAPRTAREQAIAAIAMDALGLSKIGVHDDLFDLGIDSFTVAGLITAVNNQLRTNLAFGDLLDAPTIESLAHRSEALARGRDEHRTAIPAYTDGVGMPLFCAAGRGGAGMLATRRLGRRLNRPTYSFAYRGMLRRALPDRTVQEMAARFIAGMREVQPHGPYFIAGISFGGLVAFEMARQLNASGQQVALLVLIDPVSRHRWHGLRKSVRRVRDEWTGKIPSRGGTLRQRIVRWFRRTTTRQYHRLTAGIVRRTPHRQMLAFAHLDEKLAQRYVPQPYSGPTLLLRTAAWELFDSHDLTHLLTGPTRVETIPGQHGMMFLETNLAVTAAIIREELNAKEPQTEALAR